MTGIITGDIVPNRRLQALGIDAYGSTDAEVYGAAFTQDLITNPTTAAVRDAMLDAPGVYDPTDPNYGLFRTARERVRATGGMLTKDEANARYGIPGQLTFTTPEIPADTARILSDWKHEQIKREYVIARGRQSAALSLGKFGIGLATTAMDPI